MKKLITVGLAVVLLLSLAATPVFAGNGNGNGNGGLKPGQDFNGPHYNLNIIGKKADWKRGGGYNNPARHTMFVPENTDPDGIPDSGDEFSYELPDGSIQYGSIKIEMTQSDQEVIYC